MSAIELTLCFLVIVLICSLAVTAAWLVNLRRRYEQFRRETGMILANHQNYLATHASALNHLGARIEPVATADEMQEGRWMR